MNYELALELKNAGFQQPEGHLNYRGLFLNPDNEIDSRWEEGVAYVPTLSELIEACGDEFEGIYKEVEGWSASADKVSGWEDYEGRGSTPEEAVARLWLALHAK